MILCANGRKILLVDLSGFDPFHLIPFSMFDSMHKRAASGLMMSTLST